jgi:DNA polymerase-3 subunit delta'
VDDAIGILKSLSLIVRGGYKIMIVWMADKLVLQLQTLLKLLEPPEKTFFYTDFENEEDILQTIRSRCPNITILWFK